MLDSKLFEFAEIECANNYIQARETRTVEETLSYIEKNNLRIETLILKPKTNQFRFQFLPCRANNQMNEVFNVNNPDINFLRLLWDLDVPELQDAIAKYATQSSLPTKYDDLNDEDRTWLAATVLGGKDE